VGRASARAFGKRGARVALIARGSAGLDAAKREVEELGGQALAIRADVTDAAALEAAAAQTEAAFGPIDVWVNNAMTSVLAPIKNTTAEEFRRVTEVTYLGVVYGTLAALRRMLPRDRGTIIQVGSTLAYRGIPLQASYCGAKHAIQGFNDSLQSELHGDGSNVRVCQVNLPAVNTPQFRAIRNKMPFKAKPFGVIFQPEVAADAIVFAAAHRRREINVAFSTSEAIIANSFAPALLDRYLGRVGVSGQQSDEPEVPGRPDNLFSPPEGDLGAHGVFDAVAKTDSAQLWSEKHRGWMAASAALLALGALATLLKRR
jgi:NADP-dependent 3-hydroxy acid dehydrogenase YdfG